jgi:putative ABC transport system substrate-binding protein
VAYTRRVSVSPIVIRTLDRRVFLGGLAAATLAPGAAGAQPAARVHRIGILSHSWAASEMAGPEPRRPNIKALLIALRELGYLYGEHFVTEVRGGQTQPQRYPVLAAELVRLRVDVIVASGVMLPALKQATTTIPVVMAAAADPVAEGYVQSLGHPGKNFTGLSHQMVDTTGKRLELLKELVPAAAPVAIIRMRNEGGMLLWRAAASAARDRGWKLVSFDVGDAADLEGAFKAARDARAGAVLVEAAGPLFPHADRIAQLAATYRLPAMYPFRVYTEVGGLISYSADLSTIWRRAAFFVDKILKGARPADLHIEQPTKFELVINMKTARALGLTVPPSLLLRADQVIE